MAADKISELIRRVIASSETDFAALAKLAELDPARDFRFANLKGIDLSGVDLTGFDFTGADMTGCRFTNSTTRGARFDNAKLDPGALETAVDAKSDDTNQYRARERVLEPEKWLTEAPPRAAVYVDGYNLYHGLDSLAQATRPLGHHLKWLSLWALGEEIARIDHTLHNLSAAPKLRSVDYFSAWATHHNNRTPPSEVTAYAKQQTYIRALAATGVKQHMAHFARTKVTCKNCDHQWHRYEDDRSNVAIGVRLIADCYNDSADIFYLISGDTDLLPVLAEFKRGAQGTGRRLVCIAPPDRRVPEAMEANASGVITLRRRNITRCLFPDIVYDETGQAIRRPESYRPPESEEVPDSQ